MSAAPVYDQRLLCRVHSCHSSCANTSNEALLLALHQRLQLTSRWHFPGVRACVRGEGGAVTRGARAGGRARTRSCTLPNDT